MKRFIPALLIVVLSFAGAQDAVTTEQIKAQIALLDVRFIAGWLLCLCASY